MHDLTGIRVLITGGASGIGLAAVRRFLAEGAQVVILDRDSVSIDKVHSSLENLTGTIVADVSDCRAVVEAFNDLDALCGGLDVLINNAGISIRHKFLEITAEEWQDVMNVNLNGAFYVAQQSALRMKEQKSGVILNIVSTNGLIGYPFYADYNASKAGIIELTRSMALELAPDVRVNAICPGYILTPLQKAEYTLEMIQEVNKKIPMGRHGYPEEVAALLVFLASEEAAFITGQTIVLDGGEIAGGLASR